MHPSHAASICTAISLCVLVAQAALASSISHNAKTFEADLQKRAGGYVGYLFLHFVDKPDGEQVYGHISNGNSATSFKPLKGGAPVLQSHVGTGGVRDMYLVSKDDQSKHYILATDLKVSSGGFANKFASRSIVVWESQGGSLTSWSGPRLVPLVPDNFRMAWAPEALWLANENRFIIFWSSCKFADRTHSGNCDVNKIYFAYTTDFHSFTAPQVYLELGNTGVIDLTIHPTGEGPNQYVRFFKNEDANKCRGQVSNNGIFGNFADIGGPTSYVEQRYANEACLFFKDNVQNTWWVWLDEYGRKPEGYYPYTANGGITNAGWTDRGHPGGFPVSTKHGTIKALTQAQYDDVASHWG